VGAHPLAGRTSDGSIGQPKPPYPWGDAPPAPDRCNLDAFRGGTVQGC
jgi:hypothetical protein